jgi:2-iminobutanoate/2-iminopropanoate deaminase
MRHFIATALGAVVALSGVSAMQQRRVTVGNASAPFSDAVTAGPLVFVSALTGIEDEGSKAGGVEAATRGVLSRLRDVLDSAGSSMTQVLNVNVYLKRADDFDAMNAAYREFFVADRPARTTVVTDLPSGTLVQMSAVAALKGVAREVLHPAGWLASPRPYSLIVRAGDFVFLAGLVSRRGSHDRVVRGPVSLQTRTILDNAGALLRAAGLDYSDVVAARVFLTDDSFFEAMNDEYRKYFTAGAPARATAITSLMGADAQVEISLIATTAEKQSLGPSLWPTLPISSAVRAGGLTFLSGAMGNTESNRDDAAAQARETFARIGKTLETAGLSYADVVDTTVYLPDLWQRAKVDAVYREIFPTAPPARSLVGARLSTRDAAIEILVTAAK